MVEQLLYEPPLNESQELKKILLWNGLASWPNVEGGREVFLREQCPVSRNVTECLDIGNKIKIIIFIAFLILF